MADLTVITRTGWAPYTDPGSAIPKLHPGDAWVEPGFDARPTDDLWEKLMSPTVPGTLPPIQSSQLELGP